MDSHQHYYRVGAIELGTNEVPTAPAEHRKAIEPWLSAILQVEHLNLLVGSGLSTAVAGMAGVAPLGMELRPVDLSEWEHVRRHASATASRAARGTPNLEDQIRSMITLARGLEVLDDPRHTEWDRQTAEVLEAFVKDVYALELGILKATSTASGAEAVKYLAAFLMTFASRAATRERLSIFTTNYDRLIEYACDLLGIRVIDRFVGTLGPIFRAARLEIDYHYSPPGIRGEPRYLEGVLRLSKLHGSVDWAWNGDSVVRRSSPFGGPISGVEESTLIYPNPAKDAETALFPYAELFRDFSAAVCRPNSVLITYGYGFGDDHINRVIQEMLTLPSTHLVIISYDMAGGRIPLFIKRSLSRAQLTLLVGSHFAGLKPLVDSYLPKPAIDQISWRQAELIRKRDGVSAGPPNEEKESADAN